MPIAKFRILKTASFDEDYTCCSKTEQQHIEKILYQLSEQGDCVGKPLRLPFFREKRLGGKRLYYLVYETYSVILILILY